jgi:hypothetical protein
MELSDIANNLCQKVIQRESWVSLDVPQQAMHLS